MIGTFDVQRGDLAVENQTTGEVCFSCDFVKGSRARGCYVEYKCVNRYYDGNVKIVRLPDGTARKCEIGVHTSNYNVTFYDVEQDDNINYEFFAYKLTDQLVSGLPPSAVITVASTSSALSMTEATSLPSPTLCINCDNSKSLQLLHS